MKQYDSSITRTIIAPIFVALIVVGGITAAVLWFPGNNGITTTTSTTTTTTGPTTGYGPLAANYLNSRRDDVLFFWMYNCSFVNEDLSDYYDQQHNGAFVDGVMIWKNYTELCLVEVLFAPWQSDTVGRGEISNATYNTLSGALVDDAIGNMPDATESGWGTWPIDFVIDVFFRDGTFFCLMFWSDTGICNIYNGTWDGYAESGWPNITSYSEGYYLQENGLLAAPISQLFSTITEAVDYPE